MSKDFNRDVRDFQRKFGLPQQSPYRPIRDLDPEMQAFRTGFLEEELKEYKDAVAIGDHAGAADALVDIVYVALGNAHIHNYPFDVLWDDVHQANMRKVRATDAAQSARGGLNDVIKPEGWQPPNTISILAEYVNGIGIEEDDEF